MRQHAEHNEAVCNYLNAGKDCWDWVVTTAFYSAMHYTYFQVFPLELDGKTYSTFEDYYHSVEQVKPKNIRMNKHECTASLVSRFIPKAASYYRALADASWNARYHDYRIPAQNAARARMELSQIKGQLSKLKQRP